jgi:hypothetical protein
MRGFTFICMFFILFVLNDVIPYCIVIVTHQQKNIKVLLVNSKEIGQQQQIEFRSNKLK